MITGFQRDVECAPASIAAITKGHGLGVRLSGAGMKPLAYDPSITCDYSADERIGCSSVTPAIGKFAGAVHKIPGHDFLSPIRTITVGAGLRIASFS